MVVPVIDVTATTLFNILLIEVVVPSASKTSDDVLLGITKPEDVMFPVDDIVPVTAVFPAVNVPKDVFPAVNFPTAVLPNVLAPAVKVPAFVVVADIVDALNVFTADRFLLFNTTSAFAPVYGTYILVILAVVATVLLVKYVVASIDPSAFKNCEPVPPVLANDVAPIAPLNAAVVPVNAPNVLAPAVNTPAFVVVADMVDVFILFVTVTSAGSDNVTVPELFDAVI